MSSPEPEVLRENDLFAGVPLDTLAHFLRAGSHRRFPEETVLIEENGTADGIYYLQEGTVRVIKGNELDVARLHEGECFGEMSLFGSEPPSARVVAATGIETYYFPHETIDRFLEDDPDFALAFLKNLVDRVSRRLRSTTSELLELRRRTSSE